MKEEMKAGINEQTATAGLSRRKFFGYAAVAGAGLLIASCGKDDDDPEPDADGTINLGSGDQGLLNYMYALEQLEAAFYNRVCASFYAGVTDIEKTMLSDIRAHELAHREFFRKLLGDSAIPDLEFDFSSVTFNNKSSVLLAAKDIEEIGVSAYNGATKMLILEKNINLVSKIVSVEARHAAYIRNLVAVNSFVDGTDANGMDVELIPADALSVISKYLKSKISGNKLPTS